MRCEYLGRRQSQAVRAERTRQDYRGKIVLAQLVVDRKHRLLTSTTQTGWNSFFMDLLVHTLLGNALAVTFMALIVTGVTKIVRRPALTHSLWLLVMVKLVTPPFVPVSFPVTKIIPSMELFQVDVRDGSPRDFRRSAKGDTTASCR